MYSLSPFKEITLEEIYSNISEEHLWRHYCHNFKRIDESFLSELYNDTNPGCRVYYNPKGRLLYKDFGTGDSYSIFDYIQAKYKCNFVEALNIIACDFSLRRSNVVLNKQFKSVEEALVIKSKSKIEVETRPWCITDSQYWSQYHISLDLLDLYDVRACNIVNLHKSDRTIKFYYSEQNPIYCYKEYNLNLEFLGYRIYMPLSKTIKWFNDSNNSIIQGIKNLEYNSELLILTKSYKDIMTLKMLNYEAISLSSETTYLKLETLNYFKSKYNKIISLYDNDLTGIKYSKILYDTYNIPQLFVDNDCKDISDYIKKENIEKTKKMIDNKIWTLGEI